jgi:hypothetical protein
MGKASIFQGNVSLQSQFNVTIWKREGSKQTGNAKSGLLHCDAQDRLCHARKSPPPYFN